MPNPKIDDKSVYIDREENITRADLSAKKVALYTYDAATDTLIPGTGGSSGTSYAISDIESTATYKYFGFQAASASWYIMRKTIATKKFEYVAGASAYSTAWTNRASQTYTDYATAF